MVLVNGWIEGVMVRQDQGCRSDLMVVVNPLVYIFSKRKGGGGVLR